MNCSFRSSHKRLLFTGSIVGLCLSGAAVATSAAPHTNAPTASTDLPEAKAVVEAALDAMGGRERLENVKSSMAKGKMSTPMGEITMESYFAAPGKFLLKQVIAGLGEVGMGSDGETAWVLNPMMGYELLGEDDAREVMGQASMHNLVLRLEDEFEDLTTVEKMNFHDRECYKLRMTDKSENEHFVFFGVEDRLLAGMEMTKNSQAGPSKSVMQFEKWEPRGEINMFTRMTVTQGAMTMILNFSEIEFDKVDDTKFALPVPVKQLVEKRKAEMDADDATDPQEKPST